ncbi:glycosyltransferase [Kocuria turfanensis]|uniref:glycosyltransferase n=1 Tax=Kocuria turfanensis TaxID=388357 RepID=UPI0040354C96
MRIDVLSSTCGREHPLGQEAGLDRLLQQLAARGVEAVLARPGVPRPSTGVEAGAAGPAAPGAAEEAQPAAEGLLLVGTEHPADRELLTGWLEAARAAVRHGRPVVVSGLALDVRDAPAEVLRELLTAASLVGLRDESSSALASRLCPEHPGLHLGWDDTLFLLPEPAAPGAASVPAPGQRPGQGSDRAPEHVPDPASERAPEQTPEQTPEQASDRAPEEASPSVVAVLERPAGPIGPEEAAPVLAALLDALVHRAPGAVAVLPCRAEDADFAAAVAAHLPQDVRRHSPAPGRADALVGAAEHVVTTCPRAVALGLAGGADVLPLGADAYAAERMDAVLHRWGLAEHVVPLAALLTPGDAAWDTRAAVQQWASEAVEHRAAVRSALADAVPALRAAGERWWDGVAEALRGGRPQPPPAAVVAPRGVGAPVVRSLRRRYVVPAVPPARPTVAVLLRTRGRSAELARALDGVLEQTFTDWRLVVVDDGEDPAEVDELLAVRQAELAGRAAVLHHRRGLTPGAAANRGLRAGDSELVVLRDDHDGWSPTALQRAVARLEDPLATDDGVVVLGCGPDAGSPAPAAPSLTGALGGDRAASGAFVYRRAVHGVLGDYDETLSAAADWEFRLRFLETFTVGLVEGPPRPVRARRGGAPGAELRRRDELLVRERHLRQWTAENGIGLPLYLSQEVRTQAQGLHTRLDGSEALARELLDLVRAQSDRIEQLERTVAERGFAAFWRRVWRAVRGR